MAERTERGVSRRSLLKGAGLAAAAGTTLGGLDALARERATEKVPVQAATPAPLRLDVNGTAREVEAAPRDTLLDVLRGRTLRLTGAKDVCDRGQCGACTVLLDGAPVYACTVLAVEAAGHEITTVEGLGTPEAPAPIQQAFVETDGMQCGFCTPGMVVSCAAAVARHGKALTREQARAATEGNLCRCGTYPHVLDAALRAAKGSA